MIVLFVFGILAFLVSIVLFVLKAKQNRFLTRILPATILAFAAIAMIAVS